jgi:pyrroloquinoline quinone biosynthesis protein D
MIEQESCLRRNEQTLNQQVEDSQVILKLDSGQYYALNEIGIRVWQLCDGAHSVATIIDTLCAEYDAPDSTIETDVEALLQDLLDEKLLLKDN